MARRVIFAAIGQKMLSTRGESLFADASPLTDTYNTAGAPYFGFPMPARKEARKLHDARHRRRRRCF